MNTRVQSDTWIYCTILVLAFILALSVVVSIIMALMEQALPEPLIAVGLVAASGLARLLIPFHWN